MSPDALRKAAIELFGEKGWTAKLADKLKINRTTVYRYVWGQITPIPGPVEAAVEGWLKHHRQKSKKAT